MKKLPIGIQSITEIINGGYIYIDKTEYLHKLIDSGKAYFLSRPRRFGKSLTVSTLKEIFLGNKEVFKGLYIYDRIDWEPHPVIHIDLSSIGYKDIGLIPAIEIRLKDIAKKYYVELNNPDYATQFSELIQKLSKEKQVAVLIDEYDKPIIDYLTDIETAKTNRDILKNMYSCLKGLDAHIKFLLLTGVSKFSKVSIFSDLNHLHDISLSYDYACMMGCTEDEISIYFKDHIASLSKILQLSERQLRLKMQLWYNGYCWHTSQDRVYNPFSLLSFLKEKNFRNFWFSTGTPTFIIKFLEKKRTLPEETGNILVNQMFFDKFDIEHLDIISLMFQTGYLTIKKSNDRGAVWLDYPNKEVRDSFLGNLLETFAQSHLSTTSGSIENIRFALDENNWTTIIKHLNILFSKIPYQIFKAESEFFYHAIIHTALSLVGVDLHSELQTATGRIDTVIKTEQYIYVVEFKMGDAETALQQIKEKEYYKPFTNDGRTIVLVGVGFDSEKKEVNGFVSEVLK